MFSSNGTADSGSSGPAFIDEVFSTDLYTGTGASQTITNGINLSTNGGLVWIKSRSSGSIYKLTDTARGVTKAICSLDTSANTTDTNGVTAFGTTGFTIGSDANYNTLGNLYVAWTFRKQAKFFDIVTYTGTGVNTTIAHSLGSVPGCIIIKRTDTAAAWAVYHRSLTTSRYLVLNTTAIQAASSTYWNATAATSTVFSLGTATDVNASGGTYVAYVFGHDAGGFGADGTVNAIYCGTTTSDGTTAPATIGFEPQWVLTKNSSVTVGNWSVSNNMSGTNVIGTAYHLATNSASAEAGSPIARTNSTGFDISGVTVNTAIVYVAIGYSPKKVPTDATKVFAPVAYTGTNVDNRLVDTGVLTDLTLARIRSAVSDGFFVADRMRGTYFLSTSSSTTETTDLDSFMPNSTEGGAFASMTGFGVGNDATRQLNQSSTAQLAYAFKRASSFFDQVIWTGNATNRTLSHALSVVPELMIVKRRSGGAGPVIGWAVYVSSLGNTKYLQLNTTAASATEATLWNSTTPTSTVFSLGTNTAVNGVTTALYVAYLFATTTGVSKVGSYTGNGTTQTVNCGLTAGARFVLIKRTDAVGDWYVYDTARGMTALTDPYFLTNTTAAEVATLGSVTTVATGFAVNSTILAAINENAATYIFFAIA
jgi:predicted pyridoxine 5'-phosphate oxidase superfamily flavin-nucleotide-binding protein